MKKVLLQFLVIILVGLSRTPLLWGGTFFPRIADYAGELVIRGQHIQDKQQVSGRRSTESETNLTEQLRLSLLGYMYDPRFIVFQSMVAGGIQETKRSLDGAGGWKVGSAEEYDLRAMILPKHPYNLEIFTSRYEPLITGSLAGSLSPVRYQSGAHLRYLKKPWGGRLSYITDDSQNVHTDTSQAALNYFKSLQASWVRSLQMDGSFQHTESDVDDGSNISRDYYYLAERIFGPAFSLLGDWNLDDQTERDEAQTKISLRRKTWSQNLNFDLPWNFSGGLAYSQGKDRQSFASSLMPETASVTETRGYGASLNHHLYRSLFSNFGYNYSESKGSGGLSERDSFRARTSYQKLIPGGKLKAGLDGKVSIDNREGAPAVPTEVHQSRLFESFALGSTNIEEGSILLHVRNPETGELVLLQENLHYLLLPFNTSFEVEVVSLPPEVQQLELDFAYEFLVTYSSIEGRYKLRTTGYGYSLALVLFENRVSPFYAHSEEEQKLVGGQLVAPLNDSVTDVIGVDLRERIYGGDAGVGVQYQQIKGLNAEERTLIYGDYRRRLGLSTTGHLRLEHEKENHPDTQLLLSEPYTEKEYSGEAEVQTLFPRQNLSLSLSGRLSRRQGLIDSDLSALFASLYWMMGKIEASLIANYSLRRTNFGDETTRTDSAYVLVKVTRKLF